MTHQAEQDSTGVLAVATHDLSLRYGNQFALDSVNLRVPEGEIYVLAGTNGAGKSSVMKSLLNLERAHAGRATVFGLDTVARGPEVRAQVGYIPESHAHDYGWLNCGQLLQHVSSFYPAWDQAYAASLNKAFDITLDRRVDTLSKGEARRLQFVLALAHRPPLLLLDEPTDGLDPLSRSRTLALLAEHLADTPTTVMMSTHHIGEIESLADHLGVLQGGKLIAQLSRDELRTTVHRFVLDVPEDWHAPTELRSLDPRRSRTGRELQGTFIGKLDDVRALLASSGATVRDVNAVTLEHAALALLNAGDFR